MPSKLLYTGFICLSFIWIGCNLNHTNKYAIKDFGPALQPYLTRIVTTGIAMGYDSCIRHMTTDNELRQLSSSEHPLLRIAALSEMLDRKSFNAYDVFINHLNDTASIQVDMGEFGVWERTVSDNMLLDNDIVWESQEQKDRMIEEVLFNHNYLSSAYYILDKIEPQEKYYSIIKNMSTRPRVLSYYGSEIRFDIIEHALYGLAKFKKQKDVDIIKDQMIKNNWQLSHVSLRLMKEFPDTAYFDVLKKYYFRNFFKSTGHSRNGFSGPVIDRADPIDFIEALVMQRSDSSAQLLEKLLTRLPSENCMPDNKYLIDEVIRQVWEHRCTAYKSLMNKIRLRAEEIYKKQVPMLSDPALDLSNATIPKVIRGW